MFFFNSMSNNMVGYSLFGRLVQYVIYILLYSCDQSLQFIRYVNCVVRLPHNIIQLLLLQTNYKRFVTLTLQFYQLIYILYCNVVSISQMSVSNNMLVCVQKAAQNTAKPWPTQYFGLGQLLNINEYDSTGDLTFPLANKFSHLQKFKRDQLQDHVSGYALLTCESKLIFRGVSPKSGKYLPKKLGLVISQLLIQLPTAAAFL
eukprot:TRINITY_DN9629_c0_g1_i3.p2 TRINITY_DN9629_c0_g1~~TRINITY_DN9629_c0_g1_i3.p2  ORF type:complete len:203 (+),score=-11.73 TRINITY_DN9629_c0_g1_i3:364-972(+)